MTEEQANFYLKECDYDERGDEALLICDDQNNEHRDKHSEATGLSCFQINDIDYSDFLEFYDPEENNWVGLNIN